MKRVLLVGAVLGALTACTDETPATPPASEKKESSGVLVLSETDNRANLVLGVGDVFRTRLESVPTAGYSWHVSHLPDGVQEIEDEGWEPTDPIHQSQPGFTGGNHYIVKTFKATKAGDYDLVLIEGRVWELFEEDGALKSGWKDMVENRFQVSLRIRD